MNTKDGKQRDFEDWLNIDRKGIVSLWTIFGAWNNQHHWIEAIRELSSSSPITPPTPSKIDL